MRFLTLFLVLIGLAFSFVPTEVEARSRLNMWSWWSNHWQDHNFHPYLNEQQIKQRSLWDQDDWTPEAWIKDAGDEKRIIRDFYATGIVTKQYVDGDNIPVLRVGDAFMQLSGLDQRRVLQFIDHVFEITSSEENGMFYVYNDELRRKPMGLFNQYGFQAY